MRKYKCLFSLLIFLSFTSIVIASEVMDIYEQGLRYFKRGQYQLAVDEFTKVLDMGLSGGYDTGINYASVYYNRGKSYKRLLKWNEAADDFSMVIGLSPNDADSYYERSGCFNMLGMTEESERDHTRACELDNKYCTEEMLKEKREQKEKEKWWR
jgi:tetratricopeptide (TPR) repeat protein